MRDYDPVVGRWFGPDPYQEFYSTYVGMGNNPISYVDPNGGETNPVYDYNGKFLGTTNTGLQGEAIIMNESSFNQGMSNEAAFNAGGVFYSKANMNWDAMVKVVDHFQTLPGRPDWDGYLTLDEANEWYRNGGGKSLYVDASQIDLRPVRKSDFSGVGDSFYKNYAFTSNSETGLVYGNIKLTLINTNGVVRLGGKGGLLDVYDFDYKSGIKNTPRNIATWFGEKKAGKGIGYNIYNYGTGIVK